MNSVSYDEMLELSSMGAKVLHARCVEIGKKYNLPIYVKSTFDKNSIGTKITNDDFENLESYVINGITKDDYISRITLVGLDNKIGKTYEIFKLLAENNINVDVIMQTLGENVVKDLSFTVKRSDLDKTLNLLEKNKSIINVKDILHSEDLSKVSIIGTGITNRPGIAANLFEVLYEKNINIHMITTSEIKISILVNLQESELAVKSIYNKFFNK